MSLRRSARLACCVMGGNVARGELAFRYIIGYAMSKGKPDIDLGPAETVFKRFKALTGKKCACPFSVIPNIEWCIEIVLTAIGLILPLGRQIGLAFEMLEIR